MKKFAFLLFIPLILISCKNPEIDEQKPKEELLTSKAWQLDKYVDLNGKTVSDGALNTSAKLLFGMIFEFKSNKEVKGVDKLSKSIINRGTWELIEDETDYLKIDIVGFSGDFLIIDITKNSMILRTETEKNPIGIDTEIDLVFSQTEI